MLEYVLGLSDVEDQKRWLKAHFTANGLSSAKLILNPDGSEDADNSRRVEFNVRTNADARIAEILKSVQP